MDIKISPFYSNNKQAMNPMNLSQKSNQFSLFQNRSLNCLHTYEGPFRPGVNENYVKVVPDAHKTYINRTE